MPGDHVCAFCAEIAGSSDHNLFHDLLGPAIGDDYLLAQTDEFVVMPSIGALTPGYCLVLPRRHVPSFGHLPAELDGELDTLLATVRAGLSTELGMRVVMYEHGSMSTDRPAGSCADHAHLHVVAVPSDVDLRTPFESEFEVRALAGLGQLRGQVDRDTPYLFLDDGDGVRLATDAPTVRSQYFRRELATQLGRPDAWDWVVFPEPALVAATILRYPATVAGRR